MRAPDLLYPVAMALDFTALAACVIAPILALASLDRSGWRQARFTAAYLGYVCCALLAASFAMHFMLDGGEIFMIFVFWAGPFSVAAGLAVVLTLGIRSNRSLWMLAAATVTLVLAQAGAELSPGGIGGGVAVLLLATCFAYALVVLAVAMRRYPEWRIRSRDQA